MGSAAARHEAHLGRLAEHGAQRFAQAGEVVLVNPVDEERVWNLQLDFSGAEAQGLNRLEPRLERLLAANSPLHHREHFFPEPAGILQLRGLRGHFQLSLLKGLCLPPGSRRDGSRIHAAAGPMGRSERRIAYERYPQWFKLLDGNGLRCQTPPFSTSFPQVAIRLAKQTQTRPLRTAARACKSFDCRVLLFESFQRAASDAVQSGGR